MTKSLKKGKRKRGVSYSHTELEKMIDEGLSVRDMAERLGTDSQQSVRHALERIKRERKEIEEIESEMGGDAPQIRINESCGTFTLHSR